MRQEIADTRIYFRIKGKAGGKDHTLVRIADRQQLYLVVIQGHYFNTQEAQKDKFPEIAVKSIPETGILACLSFVRVHHDVDEHAGCTVLFDSVYPSRPRWWAAAGMRSPRQWPAISTRRCRAGTNRAKAAMPFSVKWTANKGVDVEPLKAEGVPLLVSQVISVTGSQLWPAGAGSKGNGF